MAQPQADPSPADEERVSLHPFTFDEVLAGLLAVDPDDLDDDEAEPVQPAKPA